MHKCCRSYFRTLAMMCLYLGCDAQTSVPSTSESLTNSAQFEVVSVRPSEPRAEGRGIEIGEDSLRVSRRTLRELVQLAYGMDQGEVLGGPAWVDSLRFDINAKVSGADVPELAKMSHDQRKAMLRPVLTRYFGLKLENKTSLRPVYELAVSKRGAKLKDSPPDPASEQASGLIYEHGSLDVGPGRLDAHGVNMTLLIASLRSLLQLKVIDKTGLRGSYDFDLRWDQEQATISATDSGGEGYLHEAGEQPGVIASALEQELGLTLRAAKDPVEILIIVAAQIPRPL
jgi:uncharacterized protein (TIGR03435 family)